MAAITVRTRARTKRGRMFTTVLAQAAPANSNLSAPFLLGFVLLDLTIIFILARLLGFLVGKIGQPRVVGEIVAGVLLGPSLLGRTGFHWDAPWNWLPCSAEPAQAAKPA